jgi:hypothetical protein
MKAEFKEEPEALRNFEEGLKPIFKLAKDSVAKLIR